MKHLLKALQRGVTFSTEKQLTGVGKYSEAVSKARAVMPLYDLHPMLDGDIFVAPNATVIGEVYLGNQVSVWHGAVLRGDINTIL